MVALTDRKAAAHKKGAGMQRGRPQGSRPTHFGSCASIFKNTATLRNKNKMFNVGATPVVALTDRKAADRKKSAGIQGAATRVTPYAFWVLCQYF